MRAMKAIVECPDCLGSGCLPYYLPTNIFAVELDELPYKKCARCGGSGKVVIDIERIDGHQEYITR